MATTIIAQPQQLMPAYNPIKYIIDNTNKNEPGFRYIFSIYPATGSHTSATLIAQYRVLPAWSTGYGEQDISLLMQSLVTYNETGIAGFEAYDSSESWYQYDVDLGFEYIDNIDYTSDLSPDGLNTLIEYTSHGFVVGDQVVITQADGGVANPALEGLHTVITVDNANQFTVNVLWSTITEATINGTVTYADLRKTQVLDDSLITNKEVFNGAFNNYINAYSSNLFPSALYLANSAGDLLMTTHTAGTGYAASTSVLGMLYYNLRVYASRVYTVTWYDMDANVINSQSFTPASNGIWAVYVGPEGAAITQDYYVQVTNDNGFASQAYYFTYDNRCAINEYQQLIYLDRMGSWQSFAFQLRTYEKGQITREQYNQHIDGQVVSSQWAGVNLQKGFRTYNTNVTKSFDLNTNWMAEYDAKRFQELLTSPQVYYFAINYSFVTEYYCACVVEATSFEVFSQKNKKLIKQSVTIKLAQQDPING